MYKFYKEMTHTEGVNADKRSGLAGGGGIVVVVGIDEAIKQSVVFLAQGQSRGSVWKGSG